GRVLVRHGRSLGRACGRVDGVSTVDEVRAVAVWRGGTAVVVPADQPVVTAFDQGLARGDGVFESALVTGGVTPHRDAHLARMARSAALLDLADPGPDAWRALVAAVLAGWPAGTDGACRLFLTRGLGEGL